MVMQLLVDTQGYKVKCDCGEVTSYHDTGEEAAQRLAIGMTIADLHYEQQEMLVLSNMQFAMLCEINSTLIGIKNEVRKPIQ